MESCPVDERQTGKWPTDGSRNSESVFTLYKRSGFFCLFFAGANCKDVAFIPGALGSISRFICSH